MSKSRIGFRRRFVRVGVPAFAVVIFVCLCSTLAFAAVNTSAAATGPNPPLKACPVDIAVLVDRSSSVGDPNYQYDAGGKKITGTAALTQARARVDQLKDALAGDAVGGVHQPGLLDGMLAKQNRLWIGLFATDQKSLTGDARFRDVNAASLNGWRTDIRNIKFGGNRGTVDSDADYSDYGPPGAVGRGRTNWQGAIDSVPVGTDLIVLVTDGIPTWYDGASSTNGPGPDAVDLNAAVNAANAKKKAGTRVVVINVGSDKGWESNAQDVSGPVRGVDYWGTTYQELRSLLAQIPGKCPAPAISVNRTTVPSAANGDAVRVQMDVKNTGDATLTSVDISDSAIGVVSSDLTLVPGQAVRVFRDFQVPATSSATAMAGMTTATGWYLSTPVKATDSSTLYIPRIDLKVAVTPTVDVRPGDTLTYTMTVTNTGVVTLSGVAVSDTVLGSVVVGGVLAPGASRTFTDTYVVPSAAVVSGVATARGSYQGSFAQDSVTSTVAVLAPPPLRGPVVPT